MKKEMICISCPIGCHMSAEFSNPEDIIVTGNKCKRGEMYAKEEVFSPKRVITAVVKCNSEKIPYIPVKTNKSILKEHIKPLLRAIYDLEVKLPVKIGDKVIANFNNTGVDVVITRSIS